MALGGTLLEQLGDGPIEAGQTPVNLDDLIRANRVSWVDVRLVFGPFRAALTSPKEVAVGAGAVDVNGGILELASADATSLSWFLVRRLH